MEASNVLHQVHSSDQVLTCPKQQLQHRQAPQSHQQQPQQEKRMRPQPEQALRCPRCDSINTKFCYYNNYSLSQPRYFCKSCRRYWTQGGTLRNVPVGGGCRKNKRSSSASSKRSHDHQPLSTNSTNPFLSTLPTPPITYNAFTSLNTSPSTDHDTFLMGNSNSISQIPPLSPCFLDMLRGRSLENTYQNLYTGLGSADLGVDCGGDQVPLLQFGEVGSGGTEATMKQESCKGVEGDGRVMMMGLQWQVGVEGGFPVESGRDLWSSLGSNWHGLINSTLM